MTRFKQWGWWVIMVTMTGCGDSTEPAASEAQPPLAVTVSYGTQPLQYGELQLPAGVGPFPLAVIIHGGCWSERVGDLGYIRPLADALNGEGWATFNIEYRSSDSVGGGWPGTFADIASALDFTPALAAAYSLDLSRLSLIGHSAGGHLALWAASRNQLSPASTLYRANPQLPSHTIALAAITDLARYPSENRSCGQPIRALIGSNSPDATRLGETSPLAMLPAGSRISLMIGSNDRIVAASQAQRYQQQAANLGQTITIHPIAGDHFSLTATSGDSFELLLQLLNQE